MTRPRKIAAAGLGLVALLSVAALAMGLMGSGRLHRYATQGEAALAIALAHPSAETLARSHDRARRDDWTTFAHDQRRSGFEAGNTGITSATVPRFALRWAHPLHEPTVASPLVAGGSVYVATSLGTVIAFDAASGDRRWRVKVGGAVHMTPAIVGDLLLVGIYGAFGRVGQQPHGASFVALDAKTGVIRWRTPLPGLVRSEPAIIGSTIYEGLAGGDDFSGCFSGRIVALDLTTGHKLPQEWFAVGGPRGGGGIWSPLSTDGEHIYFGTGNSCKHLGRDGFGDAIVGLDAGRLRALWKVSAFVPNVDDSDVGGGVMLFAGRGYVVGKSGYLYVIEQRSGRLIDRFDLKPFARNGGSIGTPTGDGRIIVVSTGELHNPWNNKYSLNNAGCDLVGLDIAAHERYRLHSDYAVHGYAAFVPGVGFAALDRSLVAFDSATGATLWKGVLDDTAYASPTVVPSGVYEVTNRGTVFAYGLP